MRRPPRGAHRSLVLRAQPNGEGAAEYPKCPPRTVLMPNEPGAPGRFGAMLDVSS
jgi:hypothetical protein